MNYTTWIDICVSFEGGIFIATTRIMPLHIGKGRTIGKAVREILDYVKNPEKTDQQRLISSFECDSRMADAEFHFALKEYERNTARRIGRENEIGRAHV